MTDTLDTAAIRARADAATPGPWEIFADRDEYGALLFGTALVPAINSYSFATEDAVFIAAARGDVPALCDEVERLRRVYAIFEEMAPPDLPRDMFARGCFAAWEGMDAKNYRIEQLEEELANQKKATEELAELNYNLAHGGPNVHFVWRLKEENQRLRAALNTVYGLLADEPCTPAVNEVRYLRALAAIKKFREEAQP